MGGGDDAPPAPDYQPLFDLAKESATYSYNLGKEQFQFFKDMYNKNTKVADIVTDKALGEMDKMIADSDRYRAQDIGIYDPLRQQYAEAAQDYGTAERQEVEAGKAEADVAAQFEQARDQAQRSLEAFGVDPSNVRQQAMDHGARVAEAAAQASAGNQARNRTEQQGYDMINTAIGQGRDTRGQVVGAAGQGGQFGNQGINTQLANTASAKSTLGGPTDWQGLGNQGLGVWGNLMGDKASQDLERYKSEQSSSSGIGSLLGSVAGIATAFLADGGAIPDEEGGGPVPAEASPSGGAIPDDISAQINGSDGSQQKAQLNAGEFVMPKRTVAWLGEKGMQQIIAKADKEMGIPEQPPAEPSPTPPPGNPGPPYESVGAIPSAPA